LRSGEPKGIHLRADGATSDDPLVAGRTDTQGASLSHGLKKTRWFGVKLGHHSVDLPKPCLAQELLFVGDPLATMRQNRMRGAACGFAHQASALSDPVMPGMTLLGIEKSQVGMLPPDPGS